MRRERARLSGVRGIVSYDWSPDGRSILVPLDGDLYLAGLDGNVRRITAHARDRARRAGLRAPAAISPSSATRISTSIDADGQNERRLTERRRRHDQLGLGRVRRPGGDGPQHRPLVVARRPLARRRPGRRGAGPIVTRTAIGADGTRIYQQRYPAAGTPNALVELYVMRAGRLAAGSRSISAPTPISISPGSTGPRTAAPCSSSARAATRNGSTCSASIRRPAASTILFSETSRDLDQPQRQSEAAARRQPDLDLRALGLLPPLPLPRRPLDPAHPWRLGGRHGGRRRRARAAASISPAISTRRSSSISTGSTSTVPARRAG